MYKVFFYENFHIIYFFIAKTRNVGIQTFKYHLRFLNPVLDNLFY
ncbi:hypothetical protein HDEF_0907 [Candidatus Hamiltonella defensa 5AT (Acyrthosiphon pisum)]|uniref:Uncharacterized protein n=1 Tax=Hamiltonella defensa subsp. Acyrthosiphon pisum (strain 5AT) TaxID=572265 RepID=C4K4X7_HAMD5|nr:hypothetical protein HDEF_0907 [Candidatus Hamiltonella defensa 5AT (Acyrthosiphon pisum)]